MKRTMIIVLPDLIGQVIKICGFVQAIRDQKKMQFLVIRDHTGLAQVINDKSQGKEELVKIISSLTDGSAVEIEGKVIANDHVKLGKLEIICEKIAIKSLAEAAKPIDENSSLESRMDWRFLDLRRPENLLVFKVQTLIEQAWRNYWGLNGFLEIHSPKFMGGASESGGELFRVEYFGGYAYLAQSPQFYKQMAMAAGLDRVFEIGPVFRANPSFTSRHDTEFTSVDVEMSWIESHQDVMSFEEAWLQHMLEVVKAKYGQAIKDSFDIEVIIPTLPFPRITMAEAYQIIEATGHKIPRENKGDLDPEGERLLAKHVMEKFGHEFVFVIDYPISARPFYHMRHDADSQLTKSFDLLWKGLEITTGAQREHRYEILKKQAEEKRIDFKSIEHYLNFFRFGMPPHGGFGLGLTRVLMVLLGVKNVREVTYLYRGPNRLAP